LWGESCFFPPESLYETKGEMEGGEGREGESGRDDKGNFIFFLFTLVTVPRWSLSLKLSDTRVKL